MKFSTLTIAAALTASLFFSGCATDGNTSILTPKKQGIKDRNISTYSLNVVSNRLDSNSSSFDDSDAKSLKESVFNRVKTAKNVETNADVNVTIDLTYFKAPNVLMVDIESLVCLGAAVCATKGEIHAKLIIANNNDETVVDVKNKAGWHTLKRTANTGYGIAVGFRSEAEDMTGEDLELIFTDLQSGREVKAGVISEVNEAYDANLKDRKGTNR